MAPVHGHGAFHSWPWPHSIHGHGPVAVATPQLSLSHPYNCHCRTPKSLVHALAHGLRITPARISPESIDSGDQNLLALRVVPGGRYRR